MYGRIRREVYFFAHEESVPLAWDAFAISSNDIFCYSKGVEWMRKECCYADYTADTNPPQTPPTSENTPNHAIMSAKRTTAGNPSGITHG